jgi:hypothetical protein
VDFFTLHITPFTLQVINFNAIWWIQDGGRFNMRILCEFSNHYPTMKTKLKPAKLLEEMLETSELLTQELTIGKSPPSWILSTHRKLLGGKRTF